MDMTDSRWLKSIQPNVLHFFSHPDYTVGLGITPSQPPKRVADYTAGWESHPAPKNHNL